MMSNIHVRVKDDRKKKAKEVLDEIGIDMSTAINLYLQQIILTKSIPFRLLTKNGLTPEQERDILIASEEAKRGVNVTEPMSTKDALAYLDTL
jgi:DNA-damage-inducible protein J